MPGESAAQIPDSRLNALTLTPVTGQSNDAPWQRPGEAPEPAPARPAAARLVDPEDDLTPVGYPGDFGPTSVIPYQDPNQVASPAPPPYNVLDQHEPLPYVQPQQAPRHLAAEPAEIDASEDFERERAIGRRGTQNLGLLVLRVGLGVVLGAHGLQKLFGWWGGQGIGSFKNSLSDVGYQHADILSYVSAGGEIVSGALLVLGLFTPVAAAGALAFLINGLLASVSARPHTFAFFLPQGHEYQIMLIVLAVAVVLAGPGRYGLDANRGWAHRPFIGSFVALLAGIAAGIAVWVLLNGVNPIA
ncbi:membrane protein [Mycobacterium montefiorense]|nr:membrane protein [Mycobacterium montefiorense]